MAGRQRVWLRRAAVPGAEAFALLFALESLTRAVLTALLPLEAFRILGTAQAVSTLFFLGSISGLCGSFLVPWLVRHSSRRLVYSLGVLLLISATAAFALGTTEDAPVWLVAGLACRVLGVVTLTICLNLYIMDVIAKHDLSRSEPMRMFYSAAAWIGGPTLGIWLAQAASPLASYLLSFLAGAALLAFFWYLRLVDPPSIAVVPGRRRAPGPLANIGRYAAQPRLATAWIVALGRYSWWAMFYIYMPIYAVKSGLGEATAGLLISLANLGILAAPLWGRAIRRLGCRAMLVFGFGLSALATTGTALLYDLPELAAGLLVLAALGMIVIDSVGNTLFFTAVRRRERAQMTAVYATYRDAGDLVTPGSFSLLLRFFELPVVFFCSGVAMLALALLCRRVNPRIGVAARTAPVAATGE